MMMDCDVFILMGRDECYDEFRWNDEEYRFPTELITDSEGNYTMTFLVWEDEIIDKARNEYPEATAIFLVNISEQRRTARAMARCFW